MYTPKSIIRFENFLFKNGNKPKPKYFIVLHSDGDDLILASMPTRTDSVPRGNESNHGCLDIPEGCFNCYIFEKDKTVCHDTNFSFPLTTFLYSEQVDDYSIKHLTHTHPIQGIDYNYCGSLTDDEFNAIRTCFSKGTNLRRRYKKLLC